VTGPDPEVGRPASFPSLTRWNLGVSWTNSALSLAATFVITPVVLHALGELRYGAWLLVNSFVAQLRMLDLGVSNGTIKLTAAALARDDQAEAARVHATSVVLFLAASAAALLASGGLALALPAAFPAQAAGLGLLIGVLGAGTALDLALRPYAAALRSRSFYFACDSAEILALLVFRVGLVLFLAARGLSLEALALVTVLEIAARSVLLFGLARRHCPWTSRPARVGGGGLRALLGLSAPLFVIAMADVLRFQLDAAVIARFRPEAPADVAVYGIGSRIGWIAFANLGAIGAVLIPRLSALAEREDAAGTARLVHRASVASGLLGLGVLLLAALFGRPFFRLWIGKPWTDESALVLAVLAPGFLAGLVSGPAAGALVGAGRVRALAALTVAEAVANLAISIALVRRLGVVGVALGTSLPLLVVRGLVFPRFAERQIGVPARDAWRLRARLLRLGAAHVAVAGWLALRPVETWAGLALAVLASAAVFALLAYWLLPEGRDLVRRPGWGGNA
jgi:O-antigen/teichoic acid export membrane protein